MASVKPNCGYWARRNDYSLLKMAAPLGRKRRDPGLYCEVMKSSWLWARVRWSVEGAGGSLEVEFSVALGDVEGADFNPLNSEDFWVE